MCNSQELTCVETSNIINSKDIVHHDDLSSVLTKMESKFRGIDNIHLVETKQNLEGDFGNRNKLDENISKCHYVQTLHEPIIINSEISNILSKIDRIYPKKGKVNFVKIFLKNYIKKMLLFIQS